MKDITCWQSVDNMAPKIVWCQIVEEGDKSRALISSTSHRLVHAHWCQVGGGWMPWWHSGEAQQWWGPPSRCLDVWEAWGNPDNPLPCHPSCLNVPILVFEIRPGLVVAKKKDLGDTGLLCLEFLLKEWNVWTCWEKLDFVFFTWIHNWDKRKLHFFNWLLWFHNFCPVQEVSWQVGKASIAREFSESQFLLLSIAFLDPVLCLPIEWRLTLSYLWISHVVKSLVGWVLIRKSAV